MSNIIDRRLNPRDKSLKNRQKFIQRSREQIKRVVKETIDKGNIADIEDGKVRVKVKGIDEPEFGIDPKSGNKKYILPGNDKYLVGDTEKKQQEQSGSGGSEGGLGISEDDFEFILNQDEFLDFIFDDLELPDLLKKQMRDVTKVLPRRAGYTTSGNPSQLDVIRSLKNSMGRRIGLHRPSNEELEQLEQQLLSAQRAQDHEQILLIEEQIAELRRRQITIPWMDPVDVRYRNFVPQPQPMTQAVMFCVMDVSASMGENEKNLAKRFFFFLHMFLRRKYSKVDIVFIRHHESALETDEHDFFYSKESGGTVVSSAINLTREIITKRYNVDDWNIYVAQASDGDNNSGDNNPLIGAMHQLLPLVQYFAYVEIKNQWYTYNFSNNSSLWKSYTLLNNEVNKINMRRAEEMSDIWKVFKELFSKERTKHG
jgi:uncharacterized sporulation protein YeaH/YhbH (DUF444 family)